MIRICIAAAILVGTTIAAAAEPLSIPNRGAVARMAISPRQLLRAIDRCAHTWYPAREIAEWSMPVGLARSDDQCLRSGR